MILIFALKYLSLIGIESVWADDNFQRLLENGGNVTNTAMREKFSCPVAVLEELDFRLESRRCRDFLNYACIKKTDASNLGEYVDIYRERNIQNKVATMYVVRFI